MNLIKDEDLKVSSDYDVGQKEAAYRVLIELVNLFDEYKDDFRIVGGWVPYLMFPHNQHAGSVDVDILAGIYGGTTQKKRSQHVQGVRALKATGGNFAFEFPPQKVEIEAVRPDGAIDISNISVIAVVPYLVMKTAALGRGKPKDAYDIYFVVKYYPGGVKKLAKEFAMVRDRQIILDMKHKLAGKFASINHAGVVDAVNFLDISNEEDEMQIRRDVFEKINALVNLI